MVPEQEVVVHRLPGSGPALVAVHGSEGSWREWLPLADRLCGYRILALDLPWRAGSDYRWASRASAGLWVRRALTEIGEPVLGVLGHSLGSIALLEYLCAVAPAGPQAAILLAPFYRPADEPAGPALEREFAAAFRYAITDGVRIALQGRAAAADGDLTESIVDTALRRVGGQGIDVLFRHFAATADLPLAEVRVPVRALIGWDDPALTEPRAEKLARAMPTASVTRRRHYGHCFHVTRAADVAADIASFLAGAGTAQPGRAAPQRS